MKQPISLDELKSIIEERYENPIIVVRGHTNNKLFIKTAKGKAIELCPSESHVRKGKYFIFYNWGNQHSKGTWATTGISGAIWSLDCLKKSLDSILKIRTQQKLF